MVDECKIDDQADRCCQYGTLGCVVDHVNRDTLFRRLPIDIQEYEVNKEGWRRPYMRRTTVKELLELWDIDDENETAEMAQVLRHLLWCVSMLPDGVAKQLEHSLGCNVSGDPLV